MIRGKAHPRDEPSEDAAHAIGLARGSARSSGDPRQEATATRGADTTAVDVAITNVSVEPGLSPVDIGIRDGRVTGVGEPGLFGVAVVIDGSDLWATPGLIDLQVNGSSGFDLSTTPDAVWDVAEALTSHGVVGFLPTLVSPDMDLVERLSMVIGERAPAGFRGARVLGIHVEGPFIAPEARGAHRSNALMEPTPDVIERLVRTPFVSLVTLAPELDYATEAIRTLTEAGIVVALGHSLASEPQVRTAVAAGARLATHVPNAMAPIRGRDPGLAGTVLDEDDVAISVIVDRVHVSDAMVRMLWRLKGPAKFALVTDAISAQAEPDGIYELSGGRVEVVGGVARTSRGALAGSTVTLDAAVRNLKSISDITAVAAVAAASATPNRTLGRPAPRRVEAGGAADIVLFDERLEPVLTLVAGARVFTRDEARVEGKSQ